MKNQNIKFKGKVKTEIFRPKNKKVFFKERELAKVEKEIKSIENNLLIKKQEFEKIKNDINKLKSQGKAGD